MQWLKVLFIVLFLSHTQAFAESCIQKWKSAQQIDSSLTSSLSYHGLCDQDLKNELRKLMTEGHTAVYYNEVKEVIFEIIDIDDSVHGPCSVYSPGHCWDEYSINLEHTWPRSKGANRKPMKSDIHHLFSTESKSNSMRSNYPFCDVVKIDSEYAGSKLGYQARGRKLCFEPPANHKGNVARSLIYYATRYGKRIDHTQEEVLRRWNTLDPVTKRDLIRNDRVQEQQGNRNIFLDHPELINLISNL